MPPPISGFAPSSNRNPAVDSLFNTHPAAPAHPAPATISPELKMHIMGRIQDIRMQVRGDPPLTAPAARDALEKAIASGDAVVIGLSPTMSVVLKKTADLEKSDSFFYKRTAGFAGTQFFGPFDV